MILFQDEKYQLEKKEQYYIFKQPGKTLLTSRIFFNKIDVASQGGPYDIEYELVDSELNKSNWNSSNKRFTS